MSLFLVELIFGWAYTVYDFEQLFYRSKDIKKGLAEVLRRCLAELRKGLAEVLRRSCGGLAELSTGLAEVSCGAPQGSCGGLAQYWQIQMSLNSQIEFTQIISLS